MVGGYCSRNRETKTCPAGLTGAPAAGAIESFEYVRKIFTVNANSIIPNLHNGAVNATTYLKLQCFAFPNPVNVLGNLRRNAINARACKPSTFLSLKTIRWTESGAASTYNSVLRSSTFSTIRTLPRHSNTASLQRTRCPHQRRQ